MKTPLPDLIDAWLSGENATRSRRELAGKIASDPEAAARLVAQARTEAALRVQLAPPAVRAVPAAVKYLPPTVPRHSRKARWILTGSAAAVTVLFAWPVFFGQEARDGTSTRKPAQRLVTRAPSRVLTAEKLPAAPPDPALDRSLKGLLDRYWLDGNTYRPGIPLTEAASLLTASIHKVNALRHPELEGFHIDVQLPEDMEKEPLVTFVDREVKAGGLLRLFAVQAGADLIFEKGAVILKVRPPAAHADHALTARTRLVRPDFLSRLKALTSTEEAAPVPPSPDPFTPAQETAGAPRIPMGTLFATLAGLERPSGSLLSHDPSAASLLLESSNADHERAACALEALFEVPANQLYLTCKLLEGEGLELEEQILNDPELQNLLRGVSQKAGIDLLTAPSVIARTRQPAEIINTREISPVRTGEEPDFMGYRLNLSGVMTGDILTLTATVDIGTPTEAGVVEHQIVDVSAMMHHGQSALFEFPSSTRGKRTFGIISVQMMDPAGQPLPR